MNILYLYHLICSFNVYQNDLFILYCIMHCFCQELNYTRYPINPIATMSIISLIASNGIATTKIRYPSETIKHFCSI